MGVYLDALPKIYESYSVACFYSFILYVISGTEDEKAREQFFVGAERRNRRGKKNLHDKGSLRWYRVRSMLVYQAPFTALILTIALEIVTALMCPTQEKTIIIKLVIDLVTFFSLVTALVSKINVYVRFRKELAQAKVLRRFFSFKGMVWVFVHQELIMMIISAARVVKPTTYMSQADWLWGLPEFMIMCECAIFSILFLFTLSGFQYRRAAAATSDAESLTNDGKLAKPRSEPAWKYVGSFFLPLDLLRAQVYGLKTFAQLFKGKGSFDYTGGSGVAYAQRVGDNNTAYEPYRNTGLNIQNPDDDSTKPKDSAAYHPVNRDESPMPPRERY